MRCKGAERGAALTKRMLAFARRQELKQEPVDIPNLVRGMAELLQRSLGPAVTLETRFPHWRYRRFWPMPISLSWPCSIWPVNARDAMPEGGEIVISAREETVPRGAMRLGPGRYVHVRVSDTGAGMNEETLRRATEPFFTTKAPGRGTGLGLSMVHGLAEQFGGRFTLESEVGRGTVAQLWLPVAEVKSQPAAPPRREVAVESALPLSILAVDDDPLVLTNTAAMLEDLGHTCYPAASGKKRSGFSRATTRSIW